MDLTPGGNLYAVHVVNLPYTVLAAVAATDSDTYHVFINDCLSPALRQKALEHELRHIDGNHLYCDVLPIGYMEMLAKGTCPPELANLSETGGKVILDRPARKIPYFSSLDAYRDYIFHDPEIRKAYSRKYGGGPADPKTDEPGREDG